MASEVLKKAMSVVGGYLVNNYSNAETGAINNELQILLGFTPLWKKTDADSYSYEEMQEFLSVINEKEDIRKAKGVYYTPSDVVRFILSKCFKMACGKLKPQNIGNTELNEIPYRALCYDKTIYDPTCGSGVFLLAALEMKLDLLKQHNLTVTRDKIQKVVCSVKGNDLNTDSVAITKLRLFLCILNRFGAEKIKGIAPLINNCFTCYDFVAEKPAADSRYDIIIGNPPYVEDSKSDCVPRKKYGNIYANVLENSAVQLKNGGVLGFVIPLSYVSTPRMKNIRNELYRYVPEQYILSYSDRPDCLFTSVHQKLCILFGRNCKMNRTIYTGNYRYWYKEERNELFGTSAVIKNPFITDGFIPKLGTDLDKEIYRKIGNKKNSFLQLLEGGNVPVYLNMRAAFWIKAFQSRHNGSEYKEFKCADETGADFCFCLLNSSLFWWYWICVSDCWHITRKELQSFMVPDIIDSDKAAELAVKLENRLEETKAYVGTRQTEYEYKHKDCVAEIGRIDDYINELYGLTLEESRYIREFAYRYRTGGGAANGRN